MDQKCDICLECDIETESIKSFSLESESYLEILQKIVPEINWLEDYKICMVCCRLLNELIKFRNRCIKADLKRQNYTEIIQKPVITFTCYHCGKHFLSKANLIQHITNSHKPKTDVDCPTDSTEMGQEMAVNTNLTEMKVEKSPEPMKFTCEICEQPFKFLKTLKQHCGDLHGLDPKLVKAYKCDQCVQRFATSANLIQHKLYHKGTRNEICSVCGKTFITKSDLSFHQLTHLNRRNYICDICNKGYNTNKNLRSHKLVVHTHPELWKHCCQLCNKRFPFKSGYEQHMKRHNGDKQFICYICEKPFISRSELQRHLYYHSKVNTIYKCEYCTKTYVNLTVYRTHLIKLHNVDSNEFKVNKSGSPTETDDTGVMMIKPRLKNLTCHLCYKKFCDKQKLTRHLCAHNGTKPFHCDRCDKKFVDKYYLKVHKNKLHGMVEK